MLVMFCVLAITPAVFAQTTIKLFDPVALNYSPSGTSSTSPYTFGTTSVYLSCPVNPTGTISGANGGNLTVDDNVTVNGTNICPNGGGCFSGVTDLAFAYAGYGYPIDAFSGALYSSIAPINISSQLTAGINQYTFNLVDGGALYGSTEINLNTNCTVVAAPAAFPAPVCHRNNGSSGQRTIMVGSQGALDAHLAHGDTVGPCTVSQ
jgi:hypothetical protein